jgi:hypothetical protein
LDGRLGDNDPQGGSKSTPTAVAGGLHFVSISAGYEHTCGVTSSGPGVVSGPVHCWGKNDVGQLGVGVFDAERLVPTLVTGGLSFISVSASRGSHTCGVTTDFLLYCWGLNDHGQLGDNSTTMRHSPTLVTDAATLLFRSVFAARSHTCATRDNMATYCWGANDNQQLGDGNTATTDRLVPSLANGAPGIGSAGWFHNCALNGALAKCWGRNAEGELGDNTTTERNMPDQVAGGFNFTHISAGRDHTCGVLADKRAVCWGANAQGQLGDGTTTGQKVPVKVFP